jgi:hypothetical protein
VCVSTRYLHFALLGERNLKAAVLQKTNSFGAESGSLRMSMA